MYAPGETIQILSPTSQPPALFFSKEPGYLEMGDIKSGQTQLWPGKFISGNRIWTSLLFYEFCDRSFCSRLHFCHINAICPCIGQGQLNLIVARHCVHWLCDLRTTQEIHYFNFNRSTAGCGEWKFQPVRHRLVKDPDTLAFIFRVLKQENSWITDDTLLAY